MNLNGEKIFLRHPVSGDAALLLQWENDAEIWSSGDNRSWYGEDEILSFITRGQNLGENGQERFMICRKDNSEAIGCIDLYDFDEFHSRAGVGILIYSGEMRKRGYGKDALKVLITYSKQSLRMKQLFCYTITDNTASISLFTGAGFSITGTKKCWRKTGLEWKDEYILQLIMN